MSYNRPKDERLRFKKGIQRLVDAFLSSPDPELSEKAIGEELEKIRAERAKEEREVAEIVKEVRAMRKIIDQLDPELLAPFEDLNFTKINSDRLTDARIREEAGEEGAFRAELEKIAEEVRGKPTS